MVDRPAARLGLDTHTCIVPQHVGGLLDPMMGPSNVFIEDLPAAKTLDMATCALPPKNQIIMGSPNVFINDQLAARMGDLMFHGGVIASGSATVGIGIPGDGLQVKAVMEKQDIKASLNAEAEKEEAKESDNTDDGNGDQKDSLVCALDMIEIQCSHDGRKIISPYIRTDGIQGVGFDSGILEVACTIGGDKINVKGIYTKNNCQDHTCEYIVKSGDGFMLNKFVGESFDFMAYNQSKMPDLPKLLFLSWTDIQPDIYEIIPKACSVNTSPSFVVKAYPAIEGSVSAYLSLGTPSLENDFDAGFSEVEKKRAYGISGMIKYKGNISSELNVGQDQGENSNTKSAPLDLTKKLTELSTKVLIYIDKLGNGKVTVKYPKIEFSYKAALAENKDDYRVSLQRTISLSAAPLIGIEGSFDLLQVLPYWRLGKGVAKFISRINRLKSILSRHSSGSLSGELVVMVTISCESGGSINHTYNSISELNITEGEIYAKASVVINPKASFKLESLVVVKGGISGTSESDLKIKIGASKGATMYNHLYGNIHMYWSGVKVKFEAYLTIEGYFYNSDNSYEEEADIIDSHTIALFQAQLWP